MKVLVSDTSVLIDLERGSLVEPTFRLPFDFTVPDVLYERELKDHGGPDLVSLGLRVEELDGDGVALALGYLRTRRVHPSVPLMRAGRRQRRLRVSERRPFALPTMKVQVLSDLHLEHGGAVPEHHPEADVIVLAGDLAPYTEGLVAKLSEFWASAPHIIYVLGNHEFCGAEIDDARARLADECAAAGIHLLDPGMVRIEGTRFIGATLWTDLVLYGKADEIGAHRRLRRGISDFAGAIRHHGRNFSTRAGVLPGKQTAVRHHPTKEVLDRKAPDVVDA